MIGSGCWWNGGCQFRKTGARTPGKRRRPWQSPLTILKRTLHVGSVCRWRWFNESSVQPSISSKVYEQAHLVQVMVSWSPFTAKPRSVRNMNEKDCRIVAENYGDKNTLEGGRLRFKPTGFQDSVQESS